MISSSDSVLSEGLGLLRNFVAAAKAAPDLVRGGTLVAFQPQISAWTDRAEAYLAQNPGIPLDTQSKLRSTIVIGDDVADQSPSHVNSLVYRVEQFLSSSGGVAPAVPGAANTPAGSNVPVQAQPNATGMIILLVIAILVLKG